MKKNNSMLSKAILKEFEKIVGKEGIITEADELIVYENDGLGWMKRFPQLVLIPSTRDQVIAIVKVCHRERIPFVARGAGTGLSGGCLPERNAIVISLVKLNRILEVNYTDRFIEVESGVMNLAISNEISPQGYFYAPDPSSQVSCTIGGNVAENSGGPHCLKHGVTANHILALEVVLPDGSVINTGNKTGDAPGYDLTGVIVGSEGTFGIVTKVTARLIHAPQSYKTMLAIFESIKTATEAVSEVIASGIIPVALEMMDNTMLSAVEDDLHFGFPLDAKAILIVELDGIGAALESQAMKIEEICHNNNVREVRRAKTDSERALLWMSRKRAFGAIGRLTPSYCTLDGTVPRSKLPEALKKIGDISKKYGLRVANVFHAGDGNLHPCVLYDERIPDETKRMHEAGHEIMALCASMGGTISGEHGIGIEKHNYMPLIFSEDDLDFMKRIKSLFDPLDICNPGKIFPETKDKVPAHEGGQQIEAIAS